MFICNFMSDWFPEWWEIILPTHYYCALLIQRFPYPSLIDSCKLVCEDWWADCDNSLHLSLRYLSSFWKPVTHEITNKPHLTGKSRLFYQLFCKHQPQWISDIMFFVCFQFFINYCSLPLPPLYYHYLSINQGRVPSGEKQCVIFLLLLLFCNDCYLKNLWFNKSEARCFLIKFHFLVSILCFL